MTSLDDVSTAFLQIHLSKSHDARYTFDMASLSIDDAYEVQRRMIAARVTRGEEVVGYKVGCISRAIRRQFGLAEPICGRVMAPHVFHGNTVLNWHDYVCCAVEPEFVFGIVKDLSNEVTDDQQLVEAIEYISAGIEIHNYKSWFGKRLRTGDDHLQTLAFFFAAGARPPRRRAASPAVRPRSAAPPTCRSPTRPRSGQSPPPEPVARHARRNSRSWRSPAGPRWGAPAKTGSTSVPTTRAVSWHS